MMAVLYPYWFHHVSDFYSLFDGFRYELYINNIMYMPYVVTSLLKPSNSPAARAHVPGWLQVQIVVL